MFTAKPLTGDGDFRSDECIELLKQADIVVTNPPFSLFREYVAQLVEFDKKFIILGNMNAIKYKDIWPLIKGNKLWYGPSLHGQRLEFGVPDSYPLNTADGRIGEDGKKYIRINGGLRWFTNLDHPQRHEGVILFRTYDPETYPTYDNFDAIDVSVTKDIPVDYDGVMGVPISYLDKHNPEQFEIVGITQPWSGDATKTYPKQTQVNPDGGRSTVTKLNNGGPVFEVQTPPTDKTYYEVDGRYFVKKFERILIRRRTQITAKPLMGDGDFRSPECVELLKQVDIVVTNPPFSLFREYVAQLVEFDKQFIVMGNMNALKYKDIWPLIKANKLWYGPSIHSGDREFGIPDSYQPRSASLRIGGDGQRYVRVSGVRWFTNLDHSQRHESLILFKKYDPIVYPTHDNFDAIDVSSYRDIPADYDGVMGVPITLLDYFNPDQFEIIGNTESWSGNATKMYPQQIQVNPDGSRITVSKLNYGAAIEVQNPPTDKTYYEVDGRYFVKKYTRILIRRKGEASLGF